MNCSISGFMSLMLRTAKAGVIRPRSVLWRGGSAKAKCSASLGKNPSNTDVLGDVVLLHAQVVEKQPVTRGEEVSLAGGLADVIDLGEHEDVQRLVVVHRVFALQAGEHRIRVVDVEVGVLERDDLLDL